MRVQVNIEFTDEELRKYAEDVGRRWITNAVRDVARYIDPSTLSTIVSAIKDVGGARPAEPWSMSPEEAYIRGMWGCPHCGTYNSKQEHDKCRVCGHVQPPANPPSPGNLDAEFGGTPADPSDPIPA